MIQDVEKDALIDELEPFGEDDYDIESIDEESNNAAFESSLTLNDLAMHVQTAGRMGPTSIVIPAPLGYSNKERRDNKMDELRFL